MKTQSLITFVAVAVGLLGCSKKKEEPVAYTAPLEFIKYRPTGEFSSKAVDELEKFKAGTTNPKEKAVAELLILSNYSVPGSAMNPEELRSRLDALAKANPNTWISVQARTGIIETYPVATNFDQRIETIQAILNDDGLKEIQNPTDPVLIESLKGLDGPAIQRAPRDFFLSQLAYNYATGFDLENAEKITNQIQDSGFKFHPSEAVADLKKLPPDILQKRREHFLKGQKK